MDLHEDQRLIQLLDERHDWPCVYSFKFIVPAGKGDELKALLPEAEQVDARPSSGGKYTAYTFHCPMGSGREVLGVYARVHGIDGLLSL
ncbi:MAG TPA: DUF493 family protein [Bdellovibrionota bacterium]|jgi:hypothetical protein